MFNLHDLEHEAFDKTGYETPMRDSHRRLKYSWQHGWKLDHRRRRVDVNVVGCYCTLIRRLKALEPSRLLVYT